MATLNISLPKKLADKVDQEVATGHYASRSEFFRTLLRVYGALTQKQEAPLEFVEFKKRPLREVERELLSTGKYSKRFVRGIVAGLARSSLYANSKATV